MGCSVKCVGAVGLTFTIIFGILGIVGLVLACVNFKATDFSWVDGAQRYFLVSVFLLASDSHLLAESIHVGVPHLEGCGAVEAAVDATALAEGDVYS